MRHFYRLALILLIALAASTQAHAVLSNLTFATSTGSPATMTGATTLYQTGNWGQRTLAVSYIVNIGFTFNFDGVDYTQCNVTSSGVIGMGATPINTNYNNTISGSNVPVIAPFWDYVMMTGGAGGCTKPTLSYVTTGSAPNRVFVVRWTDVELPNYTEATSTFEVRLYEGVNKIEFLYTKIASCTACGPRTGSCGSTSASIGLAVNSSNYLSITNSGGTFTTSSVTPNNSTNIYNNAIPPNTLLTFTPCFGVLTGRTGPGNGGTSTMNNGDTFFNGFQVQVGQSAVFKPFTAKMSNASCPGTCTLTIGGAAASEYYFGSPGIQSVVHPITGLIDTVAITFKPTGTGVRNATLTVTAPGIVRTFNLGADAPFVNYIGNIPQGGTVLMASGDTLLKGQNVLRHTSQCFTPFSILNVSSSPQPLIYTLNDPTGQYTITPPQTPLAAGATTTPTICFTANGFGPQPAILQASAGGQLRTFVLYATSAAPGGEFRLQVGGGVIDSTAQLYRNTIGCTGEEAVTIPINMVNIGFNDFTLSSVEFYRMDTTYGQGVPKYPLLRNTQGSLVRSYDYVITTSPGIAPLSKNVVTLPIVVPQGQTRLLYITFVPQVVGKRFARAILRTNGQSSSGIDTNGVMYEGVVSFDLYGRGVGTALSDKPGGSLPQAVAFPDTRVNTTAEKWMYVVNNGVCPMRLSLNKMQLVAGDVDEFQIVTRPTSSIDPVTNDAVIAPGGRDSLLVRFTPTTGGSRRASIRMVTNDSTIIVPGISERGVYYWDVYGVGKADMYGDGVDLGQALMGGDASEYTHGVVRFKNTRITPVSIDSINIDGVDSLEFMRDATKPAWPARGYVMTPGQELPLWVVFAPKAGGAVGLRNAVVHLYTAAGDIVNAPLKGTAGTRTISVTPSTIVFGSSIGVNTPVRKTVTITNDGSMPLKLNQPVAPAGVPELTVGQFPRLELAPGQIEYLELTYTSPQTFSLSATLDISSNATNGTQSVQLTGTTVKTKGADDPSSITSKGNGPVGEWTVGTPDVYSVSGESMTRDASGMALMQSVPNPGRDLVEIGYILPARTDMTLALYDAQGRLVRTIESGLRNVGEYHVRVDVSTLASGTYHYRLTSSGRSLSRSLTVAR